MFENYSKGEYSLADLAEIGKREGLCVGRETVRGTATIHLILTNPIYFGEFRHRGKLFPGVYTPLVSKELWEKVQGGWRRVGRGSREG